MWHAQQNKPWLDFQNVAVSQQSAEAMLPLPLRHAGCVCVRVRVYWHAPQCWLLERRLAQEPVIVAVVQRDPQFGVVAEKQNERVLPLLRHSYLRTFIAARVAPIPSTQYR